MPERAQEGERILRGIAVSQGVCRGRILVLAGNRVDSIPRRTITEDDAPNEMKRLEKAIIETRHQLLAVQEKVGSGMGAKDATIFDAHLLVLELLQILVPH